MTEGRETPDLVGAPAASPPLLVLFVCLHGSAKSLIAARYFTRLARERGLAFGAESAGLEPDDSVPEPVVAGLARDGFDVRGYAPRQATEARVATASRVVSFACDLPGATGDVVRERWDDLPMVSDGFEPARDAIVARVVGLVDSLARGA